MFAENKWESDYEMVLHTINEQANAQKEAMDLMQRYGSDETIMVKALMKWTVTDIPNVLYQKV